MRTSDVLLREWQQREGRANADLRSAVCPNCEGSLAKTPKRRTTCAGCGGVIVVRRGLLCTEDEGVLVTWFENLQNYGATLPLLAHVAAELRDGIGRTPPVRDVVWGMMNHLVGTHGQSELAAHVYRAMARFVLEEERDPKPYQELAAIIDLRSLRDQGFTHVRTFGVPDDRQCRGCREAAKRRMIVEEALRDLPAPRSCTSTEGCRCGYLADVSL